MSWIVPLTEQQAEFAIASIEFFGRSSPQHRHLFQVVNCSLSMPDDVDVRQQFVYQGVWQVEIGLDAMRASGEITSQKLAAVRRSLKHLELRVTGPEWYKGRQALQPEVSPTAQPISHSLKLQLAPKTGLMDRFLRLLGLSR